MQYVQKVFQQNNDNVKVYEEFRIPDSFQSLYSNSNAMHWIEDKNFRKAIAKFLKEESIFQTHTTSALNEMIPFRKG